MLTQIIAETIQWPETVATSVIAVSIAAMVWAAAWAWVSNNKA